MSYIPMGGNQQAEQNRVTHIISLAKHSQLSLFIINRKISAQIHEKSQAVCALLISSCSFTVIYHSLINTPSLARATRTTDGSHLQMRDSCHEMC